MTVSTKHVLFADHEELCLLLTRTFVFLELADWPNSLSSKSDSVADMIAQLRIAHNWFMEELASLIKQMRLLANTEEWLKPIEMTQRLDTLRDRLASHDAMEETTIYPLAEQILGPAEAVSLGREIKKELEKLPPRFADYRNFGI